MIMTHVDGMVSVCRGCRMVLERIPRWHDGDPIIEVDFDHLGLQRRGVIE